MKKKKKQAKIDNSQKAKEKKQMYLIVGLGNPEKDYSNTRHNMGFDTINLVAQKNGIELTRSKCQSIFGTGMIQRRKSRFS